MAVYRCTVCNYLYDEEKWGKKFEDLPDSYKCPKCGASKRDFVKLE
jgi:pyruvate oxidase/acetolactate synthase-1/2/3 large subunit